MSSIDHRDAEVQNHFITMKRANQDSSKFRIAEQLAKMYEKNDDYTYGIFSRTYKFISESNDKDDKKNGLIVLAKLGQRMQGVARSVFVNKFHSPIFKLFENNLEQGLIQYLEEAYEVILEVGGNRNDSVIESNLNTSLQILAGNVKDVRKISVYSILKVLVIQSPYITFKKILQKQKNRNEDNLSLIINVARSKNIKVRKAYLKFINEYIQYIAQKKDQTFQKLTYQRLVDSSFNINTKQYRQNVQEYVYLYIETIIIFLRHLSSAISKESVQTINKIIIEKIASNKNLVIQKSLITIIPLIISKGIQQASVSVCLSYLREIKGDDQIIAQSAINQILETYHKNKEDYIEVYKSILSQIGYSLKQNILNHEKNHDFYHSIASCQIKTIHILIKCHTSMNYSQLISKQALNELASYALLIQIDQQTLKLVHQISKQNIHDLGQLIEKKLILVITKILTGTIKKILREVTQELKEFVELLEKLYRDSAKDVDQNKIRAIEALSRYRFRQQFRDVIGGFVKDKVLKHYLEWGTAQMRYASVQAAFFLCVKKGNVMAVTQMLQILQKLVRVGVTDSQEIVRQNVFNSILNNLTKHEDFHLFFSNLQILNCLFQLTEDKNQKIRQTCLKIICFLYTKSTSPLIIPFLKKIAYNCFYHFSSNFKYYHEKTYWIRSFSILIEHASFVIENHVNTLLELLLKYLEDRANYEGLEIIFFEMFKVLTQSLADAVIPYVEKVTGYLIEAMKDKLNSKKRILALKTFVSIIKNCGYVVIPYFQLTNLQQTLIYLLRSQIELQSRNDLMRIIGGLGIIDNYELKDEMKSVNFSLQEESSLKKIIESTYFHQRKLMIEAKNLESNCDEQLKIYYDELLLLHSNRSKGILKIKEKQDNKLAIKNMKDSHSKLNFCIDSMTNFNMVVLKNLFDILCDVSLNEKHQLTIDILIQILQMMSDEIQPELQKIIPFLINLAQQNQHILQLITIIAQKCDIEPFINQTLECVLSKTKNMQLQLILLDTLTAKYHNSLRHYLQSIIDTLYNMIQQNLNNNPAIIKIIKIYMNMKSAIQPYLPIIVPQLLDKFFHSHSEISNFLIEFFMLMAKYSPSLIQFVPQIMNYFCLLLSSCHNKHINCRPCLRSKICNCVVTFIIQFGNEFLVHLPLIHKAIVRCEQNHELYNKAIRKIDSCNLGNIKSQFSYEQLQKINVQYRSLLSNKVDVPKYARKVQGTQELIHQFDPLGKKLIDTDWIQWLKKTSIFLLKKSPNIILRACSDLAEQYIELGLELYNISFFYFWQILLDEQKKNLIDNLKKILLSNPKPFLLVRKTILNLAEFMNRKKCSFQINSSLLADSARDSSAYAKHLYYRELEFEVIPQKTLQKLIQVSMKLGQPQNAFGLFKVAANLGINCKVEWYEKIQNYQQAYLAYAASNDPAYTIPKLKCLSHINDEKFLQELNDLYIKQNSDIAQLAAASYANLQQWNLVQQCSVHLLQESESKNFWEAIINVKKQNYSKAFSNIIKSRKMIYEQISQLINFTSSGQPTDKLIQLQQLFQLEQLINIKLMNKKSLELQEKFPEQQETHQYKRFYQHKLQRLKQIWNDRLIGSSQKQKNWVKLVYIRSLLFDKVEYFDFFYKYCEICIKQSKIGKFEKMVSELKRGIQGYQIKDLNNDSLREKMELLEILEIQSNFVQGLITKQEQINKIADFLDSHQSINKIKISEIYGLCAKTLYEATETVSEKTLELYKKAAELSKHSKDLNMLAIMHLKAAQKIENEEQTQNAHEIYIFQALKAQMQSLIYTQAQSGYILQGFLKLLSLINKYGHRQKVYDYFIEEFKKIPIEGWINVVPQMIAQLSEQQGEERNFIKILKEVLLYLGLHHPESVLFSLNFAVKSKIPERIKPAVQIMQQIRKQHPQLTQEAQTISSELGKAAIKLKQFWYDGIESAWSTYNQSKSSKQVVELLKQLCNDVMQRKNSNSELAFHQQFGHQIKEGLCWLKRYEKTNNIASFSQAFEIFYSIYKRVKDSFQNLKKVYLKNVSPSLVTTKHYKTTIPGLYLPGKQNIKISGFGNELSVLQSKQRPRKLTIYGDNGKEYNFLLKGRQDLRLDERVMQFLNLVNKLLISERESLRKDLTITKYSIIPLTLNTGLIGWVQNCDTLNELIKQYRQMNKIRMYVQKELYQKMCPQYAYLPMINKLQIFKNGLDSTQGKDLLKILWLKSQNCEAWVQRRTNYTTSLATMSIVGYILGLGDRHPSNIMIKRDSGKVVHIDFGDCFEVAVLRQKFPEKVPFRLTRMLQKAMGVAGINGLYRSTCESVLRILRNNRESLLAVLQTFAHDPIISWRITLDKNQDGQHSDQNPFPEKQKKKDKLLGSIMNGLQKQINFAKLKQNQNVLIPKTVDMQTPIRRHHEPKQANKQKVNEKASKALNRIKQKLKGRDFDENKILSVQEQVSKLIEQAISHQNICQSWPGWCPFW